jgi:fumarate reductase iron-sulfur subunit
MATDSTEVQSDLKVSLWRGAAQGRYQDYVVPQRQNQTVLDVVTFVQRHLDPTLSYRFACRVGMCGSCAMTVNGRPRWTCRTHVSKVAEDGRLEIGPLENLPVIKDLATDMSRFFEHWRQAKGAFVPTTTRADPVAPIRPDSAMRIAANAAIECINCGVCGAGRERLQVVAARGGCHACHTHQSCQAHCPTALNPTASIAALKRRTVQAWLSGEIER